MKEDTWMVNNCMRRCPTKFVIREMPSKITVEYYATFLGC